jgi:hypothetical protein
MAKPARPISNEHDPMPVDRASLSHVRALIRHESVPFDDVGVKECSEGSFAYIALSLTQICSAGERICQFGKDLEELPSDDIDHNVKRVRARRSGVLGPVAIDHSPYATMRTMSALARHAFEPIAVASVERVR